MIPYLFASIGFILISSARDGGLINNGHYIKDHSPRWVIRFIFFIIIGVLSHSFNYFLASALLFTTTFDQLLNYVRYLPFWYLGTVAKWDQFFNRKYFLIPKTRFTKLTYIGFNFKTLYILVKVITLLGSIYLWMV